MGNFRLRFGLAAQTKVASIERFSPVPSIRDGRL
jgi:hypothetical protein